MFLQNTNTNPNIYKSRYQKNTMGTALVTIKIMPESPDSDLTAIEEKAKEVVEQAEGRNPTTKREPIAFGLNAIMINFALDESKQIDPIEEKLREIPEVNSAEVSDFRRAFG